MRMMQAAQTREAQLAALAARAGEQVAHAKAVTAAVKAAEESSAAAQAEALERRMARAELARLESMQAVINSLPHVNGPRCPSNLCSSAQWTCPLAVLLFASLRHGHLALAMHPA